MGGLFSLSDLETCLDYVFFLDETMINDRRDWSNTGTNSISEDVCVVNLDYVWLNLLDSR